MNQNRWPSTQSITAPNTESISIASDRQLRWYRIIANRPLVLGTLLFALVLIGAVLVPAVFHLNPYAVEPLQRLQAPSIDHLLGTDNLGRDLFSRVLVGAQTSLIVGTSVAVLSSTLGTVIALLSAASRPLDAVLMRVCDGLMAIPGVLLAVALAAVLGPTIPNLVLSLTIVFTPNVARLVRSRALGVMTEPFVDASRAQGASFPHLVRRHVLPNTLSVLVVQATFIFADSIITEAALSFLGAGVPAPQPSWGNILYDGKAVIMQSPMMIIAASAALVVTVLSLNLLGDGLRDLVDPRTAKLVKSNTFTRLFGIRRPGMNTLGDS